mmetsp:Transcript_19229/g.29295  ORF Transcript_19229/g.29295 Transcript_19229/m.29295 type:complete len:88 (-) Transcript_19229:140-403(-)
MLYSPFGPSSGKLVDDADDDSAGASMGDVEKHADESFGSIDVTSDEGKLIRDRETEADGTKATTAGFGMAVISDNTAIEENLIVLQC